jgi:hypothetical protein
MRILGFIIALSSILLCRSLSSAQDYSKHPALGEFIGHIEGAVFICHLSETLVLITNKITSMNSTAENKAKSDDASAGAIKCSRDARDQARKLYSKASNETGKKPAAQGKLKAVLSAWLSIMGAIPRSKLSDSELRLAQERDKKLLREKRAEFDAEFFF